MGRTYLEMNEDKAYLIYLISHGKIVGNVRLVKLVFLANFEFNLKEKIFHYDFVKWHNGPYSKWIQNDIESLLNGNFVDKEEINSYNLTSKGQEILNNVITDLDKQKKNILDEIYNRYNSVDLKELLDYIYGMESVQGKKFGEKIGLNG